MSGIAPSPPLHSSYITSSSSMINNSGIMQQDGGGIIANGSNGSHNPSSSAEHASSSSSSMLLDPSNLLTTPANAQPIFDSDAHFVQQAMITDLLNKTLGVSDLFHCIPCLDRH